MSVYILIITHDVIGEAILRAVKATFGELPLPTEAIHVDLQDNPQTIIHKLQPRVTQLKSTHELLILTDMFGSTPSNIAEALHDPAQSRLITGLNLPMLIRIMNYPHLSLAQLAEKAISGGKEGIINCDNNTP
ncbi:MAG: hypothetical protein KIT27_05860 [Legionellales bacterium]|nr:hypothetical protein [Legionellales bacterium]